MFVKEPPAKVDFSNSTGAEIPCQARGNPQVEIIWLRGDGTAIGDVPGLRQVCLIQLEPKVDDPICVHDFLLLLKLGARFGRSCFSTIPSRRLSTRSSRSNLHLSC